MFDQSRPGPDALHQLSDAALVSAIQRGARQAAAADAFRLAAIAELVRRRCVDEHPDWACDDWDACAAEVACALTLGHGRASGQMDLAVTLRDRLPKIGALFMAGELSTRTVETIARRSYRVTDTEALAALDTEIAEKALRWGPLSQYKLEQAVDAAVERHDPGALHRTRTSSRGRDFTVGDPNDDSGTTSVWGRLSTPDAALVHQRVNAMIRSVCDDDPRTLAQRRADAIGAMAAHASVLACQCGNPALPGQHCRRRPRQQHHRAHRRRPVRPDRPARPPHARRRIPHPTGLTARTRTVGATPAPRPAARTPAPAEPHRRAAARPRT